MANVPNRPLWSLQLIFGALMMGVVAFAATVLVVGPVSQPDGSSNVVPLALLGVAALLLVAHTVVLRAIDTKVGARLAARRADALAEFENDQVPQELYARTIVAGALGESIALLGPIVYLVAGSPLAAGPLVVGLGWMLLHFPARDRLRAAIERAGRPSY